MKRLIPGLLIIFLFSTSGFSQRSRNARDARTRMQPGYYFTIGMCTACVYPEWHDYAIKLFRTKGIRAVQGGGYETQTSSDPFAPIRSFEMRFDSNVDRDSQILAQIELYVGPFESEVVATSALDQFPSILRNIMQNGGLTGFSVGSRVIRGSGNHYGSGSKSPFFIKGYRLLPVSPRGANATSPDEAWNLFWPKFRDAVYKRDRLALKTMVAARFETNGDGDWTPNQVIKWLDQGAWRQIHKSVGLGTKPYSFPGERRPIRITNDEKAGSLIFEFASGRRWRWKGLLGD